MSRDTTVLRSRHLAIAAASIIGGVSACFATSLGTAQYTASSTVFATVTGTDTNQLAQASEFVDARMESYVALAKSPATLSPVIDELGLDTTDVELARKITVSNERGTVLITIGVLAEDGSKAAAVCNSVVSSLSAIVSKLEPRSESGEPSVELVTVETAEPPDNPDRPPYVRNGLLGGLLGFAISFAATWRRRGSTAAAGASLDTGDPEAA